VSNVDDDDDDDDDDDSSTNQLNSYKETVARICENYTEHSNPLCGHNTDFLMFNFVVRLLITVS